MNVVIVSNYDPRSVAGGGASKATFDLAKTLSNLGDNVMFMSPNAVNSTSEKFLHTDIECLALESFGVPEAMNVLLSRKNKKYINSQLDTFKPDIIISQTEIFHAQYILHYAIKNKIRFWSVLHVLPSRLKDFIAQEGFGKFYLNSHFFKDQLLTFYSMCSGVIVLNQDAKKDIEDFNFKGHIQIIPNSLPQEIFTLKLKEPNFNNPVRLIYIGHLSLRKNQMFLLEALEHLTSQYTLTLIGEELEPKYVAKLRAKIIESKLNVNIETVKSRSEIIQMLSESDIFISASLLEVQSLVLLEAIAVGLPIVALENQTTREYLDASSVVDPAQADPKLKFAQKIQQLLELDVKEIAERTLQTRHILEKNSPENVRNHYHELMKLNLFPSQSGIKGRLYLLYNQMVSYNLIFLKIVFRISNRHKPS